MDLYLLAMILIVLFGLVLSVWTAWLLYTVYNTNSYDFLKVNMCLIAVFDVFYILRGIDLYKPFYTAA